jgi:transposase
MNSWKRLCVWFYNLTHSKSQRCPTCGRQMEYRGFSPIGTYWECPGHRRFPRCHRP